MSDTRQKGLIKVCIAFGVPVDDAFALAPLVEEWFDYAAEADDTGCSVVTYEQLPDLVRRLSAWARLDD